MPGPVKPPPRPPTPKAEVEMADAPGPKPRVLSPHRFLAHVYGVAVSHHNFNVRRHRMVNAGLEAYRAYLESIAIFEKDAELKAALAKYDVEE